MLSLVGQPCVCIFHHPSLILKGIKYLAITKTGSKSVLRSDNKYPSLIDKANFTCSPTPYCSTYILPLKFNFLQVHIIWYISYHQLRNISILNFPVTIIFIWDFYAIVLFSHPFQRKDKINRKTL